MIHPLRQMVRGLARHPLFMAVTILTLGIGIGANTAIFSVVYGVLLKPLPFHDPSRLVGVWHTAPGLKIPLLNQGPATYFTYRENTQTFEDIGLWANRSASITGRGEPERVDTLMVTDGLLPILGTRAAFGRVFTREDDTYGSPDRVILTYPYWQRKFGGNPAAVGQQLVIEGKPHEIVGVLPQDFRFLNSKPAVLLPLKFNRAEEFVGHFSYRGIARLKRGVTLAQANADVARMIPIVLEKFPLPPGFGLKMFEDIRMGPKVRPLADDVIGDVGEVLWLLMGTVGLVLLIACANVANLFLVRAEGREQEFAIRAAMGASWGRLARELLAESIALALAGGVVGVALAAAGIRLLVAFAPSGLPRLDDISIDPVVLLFSLAVSVLAGVLFGLVPVLKLKTPRVAALKDGGRSVTEGRERHRLRGALVVGEIALAVILLVTCGLMMRTFQSLRHVHPGFERPDEVLTFRVSIPEAQVKDEAEVVRTHQQIAERVAQIAGVDRVGLSSSITMDGYDDNDPIFVEEFPLAAGQMPVLRRFKWLAPGYFSAMGNRVVAGRDFTWTDIYGQAPIVVVSENFAREYWKEPSAALGKRIRQSPENPWREIVGVVGDERDDGVARPAPAVIYWPMFLREFWNNGTYVERSMGYAVRTGRLGSPSFIAEVQRAVWSVNPNLPVAEVQTLNDLLAQSMAQTSFALVMLAIAATVALLLGVVGIYGVIAYIANQRTREVGIRMALGAERGDVSRLFLRHGVMLTAVGLVLGAGAATALTRLMGALLHGVSPLDPPTFVAVIAGLGTTALVASYLPARRAARLDPVAALRTDA